jgi:hypothetical protein
MKRLRVLFCRIKDAPEEIQPEKYLLRCNAPEAGAWQRNLGEVAGPPFVFTPPGPYRWLTFDLALRATQMTRRTAGSVSKIVMARIQRSCDGRQR